MIRQYSPNMLKAFSSCPRKFYFKYIKNISMPTNDDIFEFGKNIHALASYYLNGENIDKMEKSLSVKEKDVWQYLKSSKYFEYEVVSTEYNLSVKIGDYIFSGRLDALVKDGNRYYILDYKTGQVPQSAGDDFQTIIYMLAVKEFFSTNDICFVYIDLKNRKEIAIDYNSEAERAYKDKLLQTVKKIEFVDYSMINKSCAQVCEYNIICY